MKKALLLVSTLTIAVDLPPFPSRRLRPLHMHMFTLLYFFIFAVLVVLFIDSFIYTFFMNSPTGAKVNYEGLISTGPDLAGGKPGPS